MILLEKEECLSIEAGRPYPTYPTTGIGIAVIDFFKSVLENTGKDAYIGG